MQAKRSLYLALSVLLGLLSFLSIYRYLDRLDRRVGVVVAARDIPAYSRLDAASLRLVAQPARALHPLAVQGLAQATGRINRWPLLRGQTLLQPMLAQPGPTVPDALADGRVVQFLPLAPERLPFGAMDDGQAITVLYAPREGSGAEGSAHVLFSGVTVLHWNREMGEREPTGATLALTPLQAERLSAALANGELFVAATGATVPWPASAAAVPGPEKGGGMRDVLAPSDAGSEPAARGL